MSRQTSVPSHYRTLHFARNLRDLYVFYKTPVTYQPKYLRRSDILTGKVNPAKLYEEYAKSVPNGGRSPC